MNVINIDKEILGETPVFNGTRVPIKNLFDYLETGDSIDAFLDDFPSVKRERIIKLLEFSEQITIKSSEIHNENSAWWVRNPQIETTFSRIPGKTVVEMKKINFD